MRYVLPYRVERQSYSRGAWRVLNANGDQVWQVETFDHPISGAIQINSPVCFERKRDALAWIAAQEGVSSFALRLSRSD